MKLCLSQRLKAVASYLAGFSSNLAVAGIAVALFRADDKQEAILYSAIALAFGALITGIIGGNKE